MNNDEKILKMLEDLRAGQERQGEAIASLRTGQEQQGEQLTQVSREVSKIPAIEKQLEQHSKILTGVADNMATFLTEQQAQREDIRSLHTEVHTTKEELRAEILAARSEAKADIIDLKATTMRRLNDHEKRINVLEDEAGIPHPDKN
jgi:hypothetical protein